MPHLGRVVFSPDVRCWSVAQILCISDGCKMRILQGFLRWTTPCQVGSQMDAHNLHWQLACVCAPPVENLHLATDLIAVFSRDGRALLLGSPSRTDHGQLEPFLVPQKRRTLSEPHTFLVANYDCRGLGQSGAGDIAPVGALSPAPDRLLVLDVAARKYPCAWVPVPRHWSAMNTVEADSGRTRSDLLVSTLAAHE